MILANRFEAVSKEIDDTFNSYKELYSLYEASFKSLLSVEFPEGSPNLKSKTYNKYQSFINCKNTVDKKQKRLSNKVQAQKLVLLVGASESIIREIFRNLVMNNFRKIIDKKDKIIFTLSDVKNANGDRELGDLLLQKLEDDKNPAEKLNFQNMQQLAGILSGYFEINIETNNIKDLHLFWQMRHVIIHNSSIIDQRYINNLQSAGFDTKDMKVGSNIKVNLTNYRECENELKKLFVNIDNEVIRLGLYVGEL